MKIRWYISMPLKIILARIPFSHQFWYKIGIFKHGNMQDFKYARGVFERHLQFAGVQLQGKKNEQTILELGPGESLFSALIAKSLSFQKIYLIDVGAFNIPGIDVYKDFAHWLNNEGLKCPSIDAYTSMESMLHALDTAYLTNGLHSFDNIPDNSVDFIFSNAVLEHIRKADFEQTIRACWRVLKPGGVCTHAVDFKDHLEESINNLRFSERFWENNWVASSGFYTNRIRFCEMQQIFTQCGFQVKVIYKREWPVLPVGKKALSPSFSALPDEDLLVSGATFLLTK